MIVKSIVLSGYKTFMILPWVREGFTNPAGRQEAMVGAEMNVGGALLSSAVDHQKRSKGLFT